jgi:hypothetical protein
MKVLNDELTFQQFAPTWEDRLLHMCQQNEKDKRQANGLGWQQQHNFWQPC